MIRYLKNSEIDRTRWDRIVMDWTGQPYGLSWWLDIVSPGWEALVKGDYEAVMPLPVKKRYGIRYLVLPRFCQQLGVFGQEDTTEFLDRIPYLSYDFNLNFRNFYKSGKFMMHTNYIINNVSKPDSNTIRNIRKADNAIEYRQITPAQFHGLWVSENRWLGDESSSLLNNLITECGNHGMDMLIGAFYGSELVSAIFAILTNTRIILLAPVSSLVGKQTSAMFGIISHIIKNNHDKIIDCEGSMIPGVARFNRGFGAVEQNYRRVWRFSWRKKK